MVTKRNTSRHFRLPAVMLCITLLASCATGPSISTSDNIGISDFDQEMLDSLLSEASRASSPEAESLYYEAARLLFDLGMIPEAREVLQNIDTDDLPANLKAEVTVLQGHILVRQNQPEQALALLGSGSFPPLQDLSAKQQVAIRQLRAAIYEAQGQHQQSAEELIALDSQLDDEGRAVNHELIWRSLQGIPIQQLGTLSDSAANDDLKGWYELALIGQRYQYNLDLQQMELQAWRSQWRLHPAALQMPESLGLIANLTENRPSRVAILLPLQSEAGRVIRDGFMSAWFNSRELGIQVPEVHFYDTSSSTDIPALHQQARDEGAELIIGPLLKQNVRALRVVSNLEVPTLALNSIEETPLSPQFYQFSLAPENEGRQVAERAWADGHRRVAILSPIEAAGEDYYRRKRDSFIQHWESLGGTIAAQQLYDGSNYTGAIENLLDIDISEERRDQLSDLLNEPVSFTPRRRQDIDFLFLLSGPGPARQIKPTLGYLYAADLPVYATQDIYSGQARPQTDADLNGIFFADSPWLLAEADELKQEAQSLFPQPSAVFLRLQAFGVDAFRLYPRLTQLSELQGYGNIPGATGELYMTEERSIGQLYRWAQIRNGVPILLAR